MPPTPSCPHCGEALQPVDAGRSDTPPWWSPSCRRAWWNAELRVRASWRPHLRDFGRTGGRDLAYRVSVERAEQARQLRETGEVARGDNR